MKQKETKEVLEELGELETLLTERIQDCYEVKGAYQARHSFILYRKYVWNAIKIIKNNKELEPF